MKLLKIEAPLERSFYEQQSIREGWAVRELNWGREGHWDGGSNAPWQAGWRLVSTGGMKKPKPETAQAEF